jgi:hydroxylamine reductase (hybrid-cluster protein)
MSCCDENENILCLNTEYDNLAMLKITDYITGNFSLDVNIFFPYCDRHTLSILLFLSSKNVKNIFVGTKNQTVLKPNISDGLKTDFNVFEITTPKKDLSLITENK